MTSALRDLSASVVGGPFDGSMASLTSADPEIAGHHLWLVEVAGQWHGYQLVEQPDRKHLVWSHLGKVAELPKLDPRA
jgi:hypothetical protein